jgi:hypothetical protein
MDRIGGTMSEDSCHEVSTLINEATHRSRLDHLMKMGPGTKDDLTFDRRTTVIDKATGCRVTLTVRAYVTVEVAAEGTP